MTKPKSPHPPLEKMSLRDLLSRLTVPQLWSVCGAIVTLIAASAVGAWTVRGYETDHEIKSLKFENEILRDKETLFSIHKLYVDALIPSKFDISPNGDPEELEREYARKLHAWRQNNPDGEDRQKPRVVSSHLGTQVIFQDGTAWLIPIPVLRNTNF